MKISKIEFQGYKAFGGDGSDSPFQDLKLAPLTLIFGKNNSGKSAIVRLPRLLLGGMACDDGQVLPIDVQGLNYGNQFLDIVHGGDFFRRPAFRIVAEYQDKVLDFTVTLFSEGALAADDPPRVWSYEMRSPEVESISGPPGNERSMPGFRGLLPPDKKWDIWRKAAETALEKMIHLGPTRDAILPSYANETFQGFDIRGSQAPQLLRQDEPLADKVGSWYEQHMDGWRLSLKKDSDSFSLRLGLNPNLTTNLAQGGEGLQQVLPIVAHQLWRQQDAFRPFLDVVEQPELHLHAAAQAPLADLFIDTALQGHGQTLVETHSAPILLRVQRRVAEGRLHPAQVAIYFVEMGAQGSQLTPIPIDTGGELSCWPPGVFEEDFSEVAAISRAQRNTNPSEG